RPDAASLTPAPVGNILPNISPPQTRTRRLRGNLQDYPAEAPPRPPAAVSSPAQESEPSDDPVGDGGQDHRPVGGHRDGVLAVRRGFAILRPHRPSVLVLPHFPGTGH